MVAKNVKRKTLRDYLLEGGIKGKYFNSGSSVFGVYRVEEIDTRDGGYVEVTILYPSARSSGELRFMFDDKEATSEEVQRVKESALAQKAQ
jgi:hypothetical protein